MQTTILIQNANSNPNEFNCKVGTLNIPPNSEICVNKIKIQKDRNITIDSTNNRFIGYFGNPLGMPAVNATNAGYSEFPYLPPQHFYIKSGTHNLIGNTGSGPVVQYDSSDDNRSNNLCSILVDTLNEQNIYKMWGFAGKYTDSITFGLTPYLRNHTISGIDWVKNNLFSKNLNITIQAKQVGVSPQMNLIVDDTSSGGMVSSNGIPFPYDYDIKPESADSPVGFHDVILPTYAVGHQPRAFGGIIMEQQHTYRQTGPYDVNKDWITDNYFENQIPISWEIDPGTGEILFKLHFIEDGETSLLVEVIESGVIYDGTTEIIISIRPKLTSLDELDDESNLTRQRFEFWAGPPGDTFDFRGSYDLDESYFNYQWKHAIYLKSNPAELLTIKFYGFDNNSFINDIAQTLGTVDDTNKMGNISFNIATEMIPIDTFLNQGPRIKTNYDFFKETQFLNAHFMSPVNAHIYNMGGDLTIDLMREIDIDNTILEKVLILNIDNLPIKNYYCDNKRGYIQKRIYTLMSPADIDQTIVEIPTNLNWIKLNNKSTITLNNLNIRWSNIDGSPTKSVNGTCIIELILKENTSIRFRASNSNDKEYDNTENNFNLAQKVI